MTFLQYFDHSSGTWCRHVVERGYRLRACFKDGSAQWSVALEAEDGTFVAERTYPGRLTLQEALDRAAADWDAILPLRSVYTIGGNLVGVVTAVDLPRFRVGNTEGEIWLRADAIFGHTPDTVVLVCERDELERYRTEPDRPSAWGRTMICGWCSRAIYHASLPAMHGLCAACEQREDLSTFPYGALVGRV